MPDSNNIIKEPEHRTLIVWTSHLNMSSCVSKLRESELPLAHENDLI